MANCPTTNPRTNATTTAKMVIVVATAGRTDVEFGTVVYKGDLITGFKHIQELVYFAIPNGENWLLSQLYPVALLVRILTFPEI